MAERKRPLKSKPNPRTIEGLSGHAGEWVALREGAVVESAATLSQLHDRLRERQVDGILHVAPRRRGAGVFL